MQAQTLDYSATKPREAPSWLSKSFWSILDQGLFSISNFAANIVLANKLGARDYGAFSVAFSYFLGLAIFHTAFLTEPALVYGPARYRGQLRSYLGTLLCGHGLISLLATVVLFVAGWFYYRSAAEPQTGIAMMSFAVSLPFLLLLWLMRRTCYINSMPQRAAAGDGAYLVLMLAGLMFLAKSGHLSIVTAVAMMAACSLAASILLIVREQPALPKGEKELVRSVRTDHWVYGRWAAITGIATYIPSQLFFPILEKSAGLSAAGMLRAYSNLVMPFLQANVAMGMLLLPMLVRARHTARFNKIVGFGLLALCVAPVSLALVLGFFPDQSLNLVYRGTYPTNTVLMWVIAFHPVVSGAFVVLNAALQAHQEPKYVFYASAAAAVATLTVGWKLTNDYGTSGAAIGMTVGFAINSLFSAYFCWKIIWSGKPHAESSTLEEVVPERGDAI